MSRGRYLLFIVYFEELPWVPEGFFSCWFAAKPGRGTPYVGLYGEVPSERGIFFRLQVHERVGISLVKVYKRVGKSVICVCKGPKRANR